MNATDHEESRLGLIFGLGAYGLWGVIPLYFHALRHLAPLEVLAHRVVWSFVLLVGLMSLFRRWRHVRQVLLKRDVLLRLAASTSLIALNWFTYIYAVSANRVLEASLGYFITPLVNVFLGVIFLRERLRAVQVFSLVLAAAGVANLATAGAGWPWIALTLAVSFAFYGLMRKTAAVDASLGLFVETSLLTVPAILLLAVLQTNGSARATTSGEATIGLLLIGGVVTTVPLLLFAGAARRLRMATLGFLQYLAPSLQFVLAVAVFGEPFSRTQLISFCCIWLAVAFYSADSLWSYRELRSQRRALNAHAPEPHASAETPTTAKPRFSPCGRD